MTKFDKMTLRLPTGEEQVFEAIPDTTDIPEGSLFVIQPVSGGE
jgi:hypothetical protein